MTSEPDERQRGVTLREKLFDVAEWLYSATVLGAVVLSPLWIQLVFEVLAPSVPRFLPVTAALILAVLAPAAIVSERTREMSAYQRYGHNVARALRLPLTLVRQRRQKRLDASASGPSSPVAVRLLEKPRR